MREIIVQDVLTSFPFRYLTTQEFTLALSRLASSRRNFIKILPQLEILLTLDDQGVMRGNLISAVRGLILITNSAHETQRCPLKQLFGESLILQLHVPVIAVWMEPEMTAAPSKTSDWMNIWKAFRSRALHFPRGVCVRGCIHYGLHSQCVSSPRMITDRPKQTAAISSKLWDAAIP